MTSSGPSIRIKLKCDLNTVNIIKLKITHQYRCWPNGVVYFTGEERGWGGGVRDVGGCQLLLISKGIGWYLPSFFPLLVEGCPIHTNWVGLTVWWRRPVKRKSGRGWSGRLELTSFLNFTTQHLMSRIVNSNWRPDSVRVYWTCVFSLPLLCPHFFYRIPPN